MKNMATGVDRRTFLTTALGFGFATALPAGITWAEGSARSGTLRYATLGLDTSDPHRHTGSVGVQQAYVESLTSIGYDGRVQPWLADTIDVSPDGLVYTFKLRPEVKFHNGDVLKAADILANIDRIKGKINSGGLVGALGNIAKQETPNDTTVVLTLSKAYSPLLALMSELWILSPKSDGWDDTISKPIGTGPFTFGTWQPNVSFAAPAFDSYWVPGLPRVEAIAFDLREADNGLALQAGDVHIASLELPEAEALEGASVAKVMPLKDTTWHSVAFNNRSSKAPFDDIRVRQAIAYAIDKTAVMQFARGSFAVVTNQMAAPGNFYFDEAMNAADPYKAPDLEKAKALLAEAGVNPADHTIRFVSWQEDHAQVVVQMLRGLGFNIDHAALDDVGAQNRLKGDDWDLNIMSSGPRADVYLRYVRLTSNGPNPTLWGNIKDQKLDAMVEAAVSEPDPAKRRSLYLEAMQYVNDKLYFVVLGHAPALVGIRSEVQNYEPGFTWSCNWSGGGVSTASLKA
jgi:peptide/nickel transport system substrate-binding protein